MKGILANDAGPADDGAAGPSSGNVKQLQARIKKYEKMLKDLEKERSELKTRVTMAETQNKSLSDYLAQGSQQNQKLKAAMKANGMDVSKY